jgi:hypothetical protein
MNFQQNKKKGSNFTKQNEKSHANKGYPDEKTLMGFENKVSGSERR